MVVVDKIVLVGLVIGTLDPSAQLRQEHDLKVLILQVYGMVYFVLFGLTNGLGHRVRIHFTGTALVDTLLQEHGIFVRLSHLIGGDLDVFLPNSDCHNNSPCPRDPGHPFSSFSL